jgi:hypothetical protein
MNLLHHADAQRHVSFFVCDLKQGLTIPKQLRKSSWVDAALRDERMLPLGIHPSLLSA